VHGEQHRHRRERELGAGARSVAGQRHQVDGHGGADRRPDRLGDRVDEAARERRDDKYAQGRDPPRHQRQRGERYGEHVERPHPAAAVALAHCEKADRRAERHDGQRGVQQELAPNGCAAGFGCRSGSHLRRA
jgi:hypothetical protein